MFVATADDKARASNSLDVTSLSNPSSGGRCTHLELKVELNFSTKTIAGTATYDVEIPKEGDNTDNFVSFDCKDLIVNHTTVNGGVAKFDLVTVPNMDVSTFGKSLRVYLPSNAAPLSTVKVSIDYSTTPQSSAIQWLPPEQTLGKKRPYLFTQCQAIHARTLLPCQDAPAVKVTYKATVTTPTWATCLMSALSVSSPTDKGDGKSVHMWDQPVPVSTYLIAFCVGELESREISGRCRVWAEPGIVDAVAYEFAETEQFLKIAEDLTLPYQWGRYDVVSLPPSFPYGGMENPCLTFVTPTLLAGDRSLADVVAHEIAHSWTGNLVTNATWEHFWLNEGWTMWLQRKIMARQKNDVKFFDFDAIGGWKHLTDDVALLPEDFTRLIPKIGGSDPDDAFSGVPYEKGFNLLISLERIVGTPAFEDFAKAYLKRFKFVTVTSQEFKTYFESYFAGQEKIAGFDWDRWFHLPGLPPTPTFDRSLAQTSEDLGNAWLSFDMGKGAAPSADISEWTTNQTTCFLDFMLVTLEKQGKGGVKSNTTRSMDRIYNFSSSKNSEILHRFSLLSIGAEDSAILPVVLEFITTQGRMKFVRPCYRALYASKMGRKAAIATFKENRSFYHAIAQKMVASDMKLDEEGQGGSGVLKVLGIEDRQELLLIGVLGVAVAGALMYMKSKRK
ncbi:hypothetical protein TrST_g3316 [Triparma strigata]|uniref:Peptidase M1 leukotriene A4 hydrolase/aminopeptidase C-terminal domain-containing protein n=1 Tax=Triparma strigata TaxID=1606541 RepID=A0A9W7AIM0_9STRA|nr:hypothetical protein TrST_g3316 [Triparma strigata]